MEASPTERRQLTVLSCDLVDSTTLAGQLDLEDFRDVVRAYQEACVGAVERFGGHVAQYLGDGILVYFGYPHAQEDGARRAVLAALAILDALRPPGPGVAPRSRVPVAVRVGIHTGLAVVDDIGTGGRRERLALGETPNIAARVLAVAAPGTIVMTDATRRLTEAFFDLEDLGVHAVKGVAAAMRAYGVRGERTGTLTTAEAPPVGLASFVGRETEMRLLLDRFARARQGRGQVVLVTGDAGVGKSRLVREMQERLGGEPHRRLECRCSPYHQHSALYPVIDLLRRALGFRSDDRAADRLAKLDAMLAPYGQLVEAVPLFASLLSIPLPEGRHPGVGYAPARQRQRTLEAVVDLLIAVAHETTPVLVVEDLQWIDPSTHELIGLLIGRLGAAPILVVLTSRPVPMTSAPSGPAVTRLALSGLAAGEVRALVQQLAGVSQLPTDVLEYVAEKTDGIPLFVEEFTKAILESDWLTPRAGRYALSAALGSLPIPTSLHDSLMARLDRLTSAKLVAQRASALGRAFPYALLRAIWPGDEDTLRSELDRLVGAELLFRRGTSTDETFVFKHALVQETAYQSLLKSTRQQFHREIATALARDFRETADNHPEIVARHYTEAGALEEAITYWERAGHRAIERSDNLEAISHLERALELLRSLASTRERTDRELALQVALGAPMVMTRGYASVDVERVYGRARDLCRAVGETPQTFSTIWGLWLFHAVRSDVVPARELAEHLARIANEAADPALQIEAHMALGIVDYDVGRFIDALGHFDEVVRRYDVTAHASLAFRSGQDPGVACLYYAAHTLWLLGYPDRARRNVDEASALSARLAHPHTTVVGLSFAAMLASFRGEPQVAQRFAESSIALSTEHGFAFWVALARIVRGWAVAAQDDGEVGIAEMREGIAAFRATGARMTLPHRLIMLADALRRRGHTAEALSVLEEARVATIETGNTWWDAERHRLTGELLLAMPRSDAKEGERFLQQAIDIAAQQRAKSLELRAAMALTRAWQSRGQREEARALLGGALGWFTEGFDTPDLRAARTLLDELRG